MEGIELSIVEVHVHVTEIEEDTFVLSKNLYLLENVAFGHERGHEYDRIRTIIICVNIHVPPRIIDSFLCYIYPQHCHGKY